MPASSTQKMGAVGSSEILVPICQIQGFTFHKKCDLIFQGREKLKSQLICLEVITDTRQDKSIVPYKRGKWAKHSDVKHINIQLWALSSVNEASRHEGVWGSGIIGLRILNLCITDGDGWSASHPGHLRSQLDEQEAEWVP
jgi:hypothetical protein